MLLQHGRGSIEWNIRPIGKGEGTAWLALGQGVGPRAGALLLTVRPWGSGEDWRQILSRAQPGEAVLLLGVGNNRGAVWAGFIEGDRPRAFRQLHLVGSGMHRVMLGVDGGRLSDTLPQAPSARGRTATEGPWSRTIGALGGEDTWRRLVGLEMALVGCGRTGSLMAASLARLGVHRLSLIDPDHLEVHSLAEMDLVGIRDVSSFKVEAVADHLPGIGDTRVDVVPESILSGSGISACIRADVIISCVDDDSARLAAGILAAANHKVLLDIGTGVRFEPATRHPGYPPGRIMGADVRLVLPGSACLLCAGGVIRYAEGIRRINGPGPATLRTPRWHETRAGSLRTLNQIAVHAGLQALQDLVAERIESTTWLRLEVDATGQFDTSYPEVGLEANPENCELCAVAGMGLGSVSVSIDHPPITDE